ncbi:hypothetical protein LTR66_003797 [Elasticomyces elasticus]|nr:hypothetical protein LTR66_003797 [Elasticomyces elasticus]
MSSADCHRQQQQQHIYTVLYADQVRTWCCLHRERPSRGRPSSSSTLSAYTTPTSRRAAYSQSPELSISSLVKAAGHTPYSRTPTEQSNYYTASSGSPDEKPLPRSELSGDRKHSKAGLEDTGLNPTLGLDRLLPARLYSSQVSSPSDLRSGTVSRNWSEARDTQESRRVRPQIKRAFTEDWVREHNSWQWASERGNWWSDESVDSETEGKKHNRNDGATGSLVPNTVQKTSRRSKAPESPSLSRPPTVLRATTADGLTIIRTRGHRPRHSNLTLNQEDFRDTLRRERAVRQSVMTTAPDGDTHVVAGDLQRSSSTAAKPPLTPPPVFRSDVSGTGPPVTPMSSRAAGVPSTPRPKKRIAGRGRVYVVSIPIDTSRGTENGPPRPLSPAAVEARFRLPESLDHEPSGDHPTEISTVASSAHTRPIFPDMSEYAEERRSTGVKIRLADPKEWASYVDWLTEKKLRALGVSTGHEEPVPGLSYQSSSPPLPSLSAAGRHARQISQALSNTLQSFPPGPQLAHGSPIALPLLPPVDPSAHMYHPTLGLPFTLSPQVTAPNGLPAFPSQQSFDLGGIPRGGSPAQQPQYQQLPFEQQSELPARVQSHVQNIGQMRQQAQSHLPEIRPDLTLAEVPTAEDEETDAAAASRPITAMKERPQVMAPTPIEREFNPRTTFGTASLSASSNAFRPARTRLSSIPSARQGLVQDRHQPPGNLNVTAPVFKPARAATAAPPSGLFSFSAQRPGRKPSAPVVESPGLEKAGNAGNAARFDAANNTLQKIFGTVNPRDFVKPSKRSKAIAIVRPNRSSKGAQKVDEAVEDEDGRITQSDERQKRMRFGGDDGDEVPQFASPMTPESFDEHNGIEQGRPSVEFQKLPQDELTSTVGDGPLLDASECTQDRSPMQSRGSSPVEAVEQAVPRAEGTETPVPDKQFRVQDQLPGISHAERPKQHTQDHTSATVEGNVAYHGIDSPLSATAEPLKTAIIDRPLDSWPTVHLPKDTDESEHQDAGPHRKASPAQRYNESPATTVKPSEDGSFQTAPEPQGHSHHINNGSVDHTSHVEPTFDEIDAVMRHLDEHDFGTDGQEVTFAEVRPRSALRSLNVNVKSPDNLRSEVPSPSLRHLQPVAMSREESFSASLDPFSDRRAGVLDHSPVHRLYPTGQIPASDWSDFPSTDEDKTHQHSQFFHNHIEGLLDGIVRQRLSPLESALAVIQDSVSALAPRSISRPNRRSASVLDSDADDEDDDEDSADRRCPPISRAKEKKLNDIKGMIAELQISQNTLVNGPRRSEQLSEVQDALIDLRSSVARTVSANVDLGEFKAVVEEALGRQRRALVTEVDDVVVQQNKLQISELEGRLGETLAGALEEANQRRAAEEREADIRHMLRLAEEETARLRTTDRDRRAQVQAIVDERNELREKIYVLENSEAELDKQNMALEADATALASTLEEYRTSSNKWRDEIDRAAHEKESLRASNGALKARMEESLEIRECMRRKLDALHTAMAGAASQVASEKAVWQERVAMLAGRLDAEKNRSATLEERYATLDASAKDGVEAKLALEQLRLRNIELEQETQSLRIDCGAHQIAAVKLQGAIHEEREVGRVELDRTRLVLQAEIDTVSKQLASSCAAYESQIAMLREQLEITRAEAATRKLDSDSLLHKVVTSQRDAVERMNEIHGFAIRDLRQHHEERMQELNAQHNRVVADALEDKQRSELLLNERLSLSDAKLGHFQDKVLHLEEKLDVAKSAAQAAIIAAQSARSAPAPQPPVNPVGPERISPQALRESILVLQEQLQERESRIERLESKISSFDTDAPAKLKEHDMEVSWLRELLAVRNEDISELVNTLSQSTYDRGAVRDAAIRIRSNLQMEQQEKERLMSGGQSLPEQALISISNFASPKAVQLAAALGNWRKGRDLLPSSLSQSFAIPARTQTPSKTASPISAQSFLSGFMTPPSSNIRRSPNPRMSRQTSKQRTTAQTTPPPAIERDAPMSNVHEERPAYEPSSSTISPLPLLQGQDYDQDAEDGAFSSNGFYDDEDSTVDSNGFGSPDTAKLRDVGDAQPTLEV